MEAALWTCLALTLLSWSVSWAMFARPRRVPAPPDDGPASTRVSVVIPARNEEGSIGILLDSLERQRSRPHEILVIDDRSEDRTAAVASEYGVGVATAPPAPDGWVGKSWACQQGLERATGDWLLFLDADTELEPGGLERIAALAGAGEDHAHSVCPYHTVSAPYEQLSSFFNAISALGANAFSLKGNRAAEIGLFGQVLLVPRERFANLGGYAAVKGHVLENFALAGHLRSAGIVPSCWLGRGSIRMRMYPGGLRELIAGWSKGVVSGAGSAPRSVLFGVSLWFSALFLAAIALAFIPVASSAAATAAAGVYLLATLQVAVLFRLVGNFSPLASLFYPVPLIFYQLVFFAALWHKRSGKSVYWKGRDVG